MLEPHEFVEIFMDTPIDVCEVRDPKGMYKKARAGQVKEFTGISAPYEPPLKPEIVLRGDAKDPDGLADEVIAHLESAGHITSR